MARTWTPEQAASLAADPSALKAAQGLAAPRKWTLLGGDGEFVWGLAQGSGASPYQVQVDLGEPAFKCSCPSRKFPCKHGLGLLLLLADQPGSVGRGERPGWVAEWIEKRAQKAARSETKAAEPAAATDPEAQARRREKRGANVAQGFSLLDGWIRDLARQGLAAAGSVGYEFWDGPARRLVDAQAPGLARRVRALGAVVAGGAATEDAALAELGRLHLLIRAGLRRGELPPEWREEIDTQAGWTVDQEELRQRPGVRATWFVGAQAAREEDKLVVRASHLFAANGEVATILEFSPAARPTVSSLALGRWAEGELVYFPGIGSRRALWKSPPRDAPAGALPFFRSCEELLDAHARNLAANPFADPRPALVELLPQIETGRLWLRDGEGAGLPVTASFALGWELLACAGGRALQLAGLWDGFAFTPLTALADGSVLQLSPRVLES